jgi:hypothetical protein
MTGSNWPQKAIQCLKYSSRVDLEGEPIDDLGRLGQLKLMRQLNLSFVQLDSLAGLKPQPQLEAFTADDSQISSFINFIAIENVRKLSLRKTPVSSNPQFLLSAAIICPNLANLNGRQVSQTIQQRAQSCPRLGRLLVNAGWFAVFPYPSDYQLSQLAATYRVSSESEVAEPPEEEEEVGDTDIDRFEDVLTGFFERHQRLVRTVKRRLGFPVEKSFDYEREEEVLPQPISESSSSKSETSLDEAERVQQLPVLVSRLAGVLKDHAVELDDNNLCESVLDAVDRLCAENNERRLSRLEGDEEGNEKLGD